MARFAAAAGALQSTVTAAILLMVAPRSSVRTGTLMTGIRSRCGECGLLSYWFARKAATYESLFGPMALATNSGVIHHRHLVSRRILALSASAASPYHPMHGLAEAIGLRQVVIRRHKVDCLLRGCG